MLNFNILKRLYERAPMNFYSTDSGDYTIIRSVNNTSLGYKLNKKLTDEELGNVWKLIKKHKRGIAIIAFIFFIIILYGIIFPCYSFIIAHSWYFTLIPLLLLIIVVSHFITMLNTRSFEKALRNEYGEFETTIFNAQSNFDLKYYKLFKIELVKAITLIILFVVSFEIISPFKTITANIQQEKYDKVIKLTTLGSKIFPIAPEWYSLRAYSKFKLKDYEGAIQDYDKAYKLGTDEYNIMNFDNKIFIKYFIKDYQGALHDFDREIDKADNDFEKDSFMWDKAQFLYNIGKYQEALKVYNQLLIKAENDRIFLLKNRLYFERAQVYKKLKKEDLANEDLQNAEALEVEQIFEKPIPEPTLIMENI